MRLALARRCAAVAVVGLLAAPAASAQEVWLDAQQPSAQALQALALLEDAGADGLDPADYDAAGLRHAAAAAARPQATVATRRAFDAALTRAFERFLADLARGRVEPRAVRALYPRPPAPDTASLLRAALAADRLPQAVREAAPALSQYEELRRLLAEYRALGANKAWQQPLPPLPRGRLDPGQPYDGLAQLAQRLIALGDLPAGTPLPPHYEAALVDAVRAFQRRHGLLVDGVIGRATRAELEISPARRAQQIALAMERLRWTPAPHAARAIVVNLPQFALHAYDGHLRRALEMPVVVGAAAPARKRTPLFAADLRYLEFSPFWDIPRSIVEHDLGPRLRRDANAFEREGFEFVTGDGRVARQFDQALLAAVLRGQARMRQRPGPENAMGQIKFALPNPFAIYLHDTPETALFERVRRDFSHGCIRVRAPVALANFVLAGEPGWDEARIVAAMGRDRPLTARLRVPVPVVIEYRTAVAVEGRPHFYPDIYGLDRVLTRALARSPAAAGSTGR
jgi:murein L,D-transpeptidase YcbB/YkuD